MKHKYIIAIGFSCLILLALLAVIFSLFTPPALQQTGTSSPTPVTNKVTGGQQPNASPTPTISEDKNVEKAVNLLQNRQLLSSTDNQTKATIISLQQPNVDAVYSTDTYHIDYIHVLDEFQVEVDTTDVQKTMADAVTWFMLQGMSHEGICKLPLTFYGNYTLKQQGIEVPALAEGC